MYFLGPQGRCCSLQFPFVTLCRFSSVHTSRASSSKRTANQCKLPHLFRRARDVLGGRIRGFASAHSCLLHSFGDFAPWQCGHGYTLLRLVARCRRWWLLCGLFSTRPACAQQRAFLIDVDASAEERQAQSIRAPSTCALPRTP